MNKQTEIKPAIVPERATQDGEIRVRWAWVEPSVWTDRMLAALEKGVKGNVWFSLIDKVYSLRNLQSAYAKVKANGGAAGVDHQTIERYEEKKEANLEKLSEQLREGTYQPQAIRRHWIAKMGSREERPLGIPTVRDRVSQAGLRHVIEPIFERDFAEQSYGFRPNRGCKDALRRVDALLKAGYTHVVDADIKSYFDSIPFDPLMKKIEEKIADGRVLKLIRAYLNQRVMDRMKEWTPTEGTPQGAVLSPLLSNIYLDPLDHLMVQKGIEMVRYADDTLILCRSREEAQQALVWMQQWTEEAGLTLHPTKTKVVDATQDSFDFLGYHFERGHRWPRPKSRKKFRDTIRAKTRRCNGQSLSFVIANVNRTTKGWFEYFKHSYKPTFEITDGWIRMRLRSILRKRNHRRGRGRGADHQRWPNKYFRDQGLFSMTMAHEALCQSA